LQAGDAAIGAGDQGVAVLGGGLHQLLVLFGDGLAQLRPGLGGAGALDRGRQAYFTQRIPQDARRALLARERGSREEGDAGKDSGREKPGQAPPGNGHERDRRAEFSVGGRGQGGVAKQRQSRGVLRDGAPIEASLRYAIGVISIHNDPRSDQ